ncbi:MAG: tyrosine-type recombinase/integrase [Bdellovibrionales bacterium]|nr:tyrosine-type recombinase/integrase [Bdellovibrionales bacterium]
MLRRIRYHDLRHTALTLLVKKGVLLPIVQKIAGHKDIKTTMKYVHVLGKDIDDIGAMSGLKFMRGQFLSYEYCEKSWWDKV